MVDPAFYVRSGDSGALLEGTPGNVLTFQPDGSLAGEPPSGGGEVVASFLGADVVDVTTEPELNGVFYTATVAGWFRLSWVLATVAPFAPGVDAVLVNAFVGPPSENSVQLRPGLQLYQGGEGTQAFTTCTPADVYLRVGQTLELQGLAGAHVTIGVRLERL